MGNWNIFYHWYRSHKNDNDFFSSALHVKCKFYDLNVVLIKEKKVGIRFFYYYFFSDSKRLTFGKRMMKTKSSNLILFNL